MASLVSYGTARKPATSDVKAVLEQRCTQLEERIAALELLVKDLTTTNAVGTQAQLRAPVRASDSAREKEKRGVTDANREPLVTTAKELEDETSKASEAKRVRNVVSKWHDGIGSRQDFDIRAVPGTEEKRRTLGRAFTFRRVMHTNDGNKFKYSEVDIEGGGLRNLLKDVIGESYPGQSWAGDIINMIGPFTPIVHYWDDLIEAGKEKNKDTTELKQARQDLTKLLDHVKSSSELEAYFKTRESNRSSKTTTYQTMWTLFRPGMEVVAKPFMGLPQIFKVTAPPDPWENSNLSVECWCYDWNGKEMVKVSFSFPIEKFRGAKDINSLSCYPLEYYNEGGNTDQKGLRSRLTARGRIFKDRCTVKMGAKQMFGYDDMALSTSESISRAPGRDQSDDNRAISSTYGDDWSQQLPRANRTNTRTFKVKGRVIVDADAFLQFGPGTALLGKFTPIDVEGSSLWRSGEYCGSGEEPVHLFPPRVLGYATQQKMWGQFNVRSTKDVSDKRSSTVFDTKLQLDSEYKSMIKALVENHETKGDMDQVNDIVEGKGKGLVILLHGPPGVGKTLTAEAIAEATGKPLFVVSVAEIGLNASRAEKNLEEMFYLAGAWEAVLLIDEADVFLESRTIDGNPNRNALVSVLLRVLEYYEGIMVLTTNRITSLDIAVQSRIHLAIRYDDLYPKQRAKIFDLFLDQLNIHDGDREDIKEWIKEYGSGIKLNGRQIRNVVSSAQALARGERQGLRKDHIKRVMDTTREFQEQLESLVQEARANNEVKGRRRG